MICNLRYMHMHACTNKHTHSLYRQTDRQTHTHIHAHKAKNKAFDYCASTVTRSHLLNETAPGLYATQVPSVSVGKFSWGRTSNLQEAVPFLTCARAHTHTHMHIRHTYTHAYKHIQTHIYIHMQAHMYMYQHIIHTPLTYN